MHKPFGQIPTPNPRAASKIADAARRVERLFHNDLDADNPKDSDDVPKKGVYIPADERRYDAPFARANREEDYRVEWAFFEQASKSSGMHAR